MGNQTQPSGAVNENNMCICVFGNSKKPLCDTNMLSAGRD